MDLLVRLARALPLTLAAVALLLLVLVVVAIVLVRRAHLPGIALPESDDLPLGEEIVWVDLRSRISAALRRSFLRARGRERRGGAAGAPRFLLLGQSGSGKSSLLEGVPLSLPSGRPVPPAPGGAPVLGWWAFTEGTVLDVPGAWVLRLDGSSSDAAAWMSLLRTARASRPRRPADGVVLTLPADALFAPDRPAAELRAEAARRGARLNDKLVQLQQVLGMRLPVTVLLTRADRIPGFSAFADGLPQDLRQQIFGWSVPETPDSPFRSEWADEAVAALVQAARAAQAVERRDPAASSEGNGTGAENPGDGEEAAPPSFAENLRSLAPQIRIYLSQLFARGVPGDSCFFRGLYMCGARFGVAAEDSAGEHPSSAGVTGVAGSRPDEVLFLRDLLQRKVFAEAPLGRPTARAEAARLRRMQAVQALCLLVPVLGGLGGWWAQGRTRDAARTLEPLLHVVESGLGSVRSGGAGAQPGARQREARQILAAAGGVERYRLRSLLLPASWPSPLDDRVRQVLVDGTEKVLLPALHRSLSDSARALAGTRARCDAVATAVTAPEQTPQLQRLARFVAAVGTLDRERAAYRCLEVKCGSRQRLLADFRELTGSLWGEPFGLPGTPAERVWGGVLRRAEAPRLVLPRETSARFQEITRRLACDFYRVLLVANPVVEELAELERELVALEVAGGLEQADVQTYHRLAGLIDRLKEDLARPDLAWMGAERLDLGAGVASVWDAVGRTPELGPALQAELQATGEGELRRLQARLPKFSSQGTGPLLARQDGHVQLALSDGVDQVGTAVQGLLAQSFVAATGQAVPWQPGPRERFTWDTAKLQKAAALIPSYDDYVTKGIEAFPQDLRDTTAEVALTALGKEVVDRVVAAQRFVPDVGDHPPQPLERDVAARSANLTEANEALEQILGGLGRLGLTGEAAAISWVVTSQEIQLLEDTDRLLDEERLYRPHGGSFAWWDGLAPPAPGAFDATSTKQLDAYLKGQRQIVTRLAHDAQPALAGLTGRGEALDPKDAARVEKWSTILADLEAAKDKAAGNPVTELEDFVARRLTAVTLSSCFSTRAPAAGTPFGDDYFTGRLRDLEATLRGRCDALAAGYGRACYAEMAQVFNERLARQFPFSSDGPHLFDRPAQPAALTAFYGVFDRSAWLLAEVPAGSAEPAGQAAFGPVEDEVRTFVEEMGGVRPLVAPFLDDPKTYPAPTLGFTVDFRVNRRDEVGAEDVLGWQLAVGSKTYRRGQEPLTGTWTVGTPVHLELEWAQDSPIVPAEVVDSRLGRVDGRRVIYQYDGPWALLGLLRDHPTVAGAQPNTLDVEVKTHSAAGGALSPPDDARLFVRLVLLTPDEKTVVPWPAAFPTQAPVLASGGPRGQSFTCPVALEAPSPPAAPTDQKPASPAAGEQPSASPP